MSFAVISLLLLGFKTLATESANRPFLTQADLQLSRLPCSSNNQPCCLRLKIADSKPSLACTNLSYNQQTKTVRMNLKLDGTTLYDNDIAISETPVVCVPVPMVPFVNICGQLYDLALNDDETRACLRLTLQIFNEDQVGLDLQCLSIPTSIITEQNVQRNENAVENNRLMWRKHNTRVNQPIAATLKEIATEL